MRGSTMTGAAIIVAALLSGCFAASGDKTGNPQPSRTLVLANSDLHGLVSAPGVDYFVDQVDELSDGRLQISVRSEWEGGNDEPRVIRGVAAGKAALGWSGTRAFDRVGINAFQPLHAPFLVGTYPAQAAVVADPVAHDMLGGLEPVGLTGLGLFADELRMPASAEKPVLSPGDFRGLAFGTFDSAVQTDALASLGAEPRTMSRPNRPDTDDLDALETMWRTYVGNAQHDLMRYVTRNAVLWPRTVAVFANTDELGRLTADERGWLTEAASRATAWSVEHAQDQEIFQVAQACGRGARVATATAAQLSSLREAAEPFYAMLRADADLGGSMRRVESAVAGAPEGDLPGLPAGCAYSPGESPLIGAEVEALTGPGRPGGLPPGTYRYSVSMDELQGNGLSPLDSQANAGVWTWRLGDGRWSWTLQPSEENPPGYAGNYCAGYYDVDGRRVDFTRVTEYYPDGECAPRTWPASWSRANDGLVMHHIIDDDLDYIFGGKRWERIASNN